MAIRAIRGRDGNEFYEVLLLHTNFILHKCGKILLTYQMLALQITEKKVLEWVLRDDARRVQRKRFPGIIPASHMIRHIFILNLQS